MKNSRLILFLLLMLSNATVTSQTAEEFKKLGNKEYDKENYTEAIKYYEKAIAVDTNYYDAYYNLGNVYGILSDFDQSIFHFSKAKNINDQNPDVFFLLGFAYSEKGEIDTAIDLFKKGLHLNPDSPGELYLLASFYEEKESYRLSHHYVKKAAQLGDSLAKQYFYENDMSWEDHYFIPEYDRIKENIQNKESRFNYDLLWKKFSEGDSMMTTNEKQHLYYGYVFQENYNPYASSYDSKKANAILNKSDPSPKEWEELITLLNIGLATQPFNCRYLYYKSIAYEHLNKPQKAQENLNKIVIILDALYSTGDGLEKETAIHVIAVYSEYDFLFVNEVDSVSQSLVDGGYDVLTLDENEEGLEELWFEVNRPLMFLEMRTKD